MLVNRWSWMKMPLRRSSKPWSQKWLISRPLPPPLQVSPPPLQASSPSEQPSEPQTEGNQSSRSGIQVASHRLPSPAPREEKSSIGSVIWVLVVLGTLAGAGAVLWFSGLF